MFLLDEPTSLYDFDIAPVPRIVDDHLHCVPLELVFEFQQLEESFELLQYCLIIEVGVATDVDRSSCCTRHVIDTHMCFELQCIERVSISQLDIVR